MGVAVAVGRGVEVGSGVAVGSAVGVGNGRGVSVGARVGTAALPHATASTSNVPTAINLVTLILHYGNAAIPVVYARQGRV
ncbi:MAG: hypothetical protein OXI91_13590 [Chloroflexota bacterium]|nr:hypothetical protein [Chloroflexota bacterium]